MHGAGVRALRRLERPRLSHPTRVAAADAHLVRAAAHAAAAQPFDVHARRRWPPRPPHARRHDHAAAAISDDGDGRSRELDLGAVAVTRRPAVGDTLRGAPTRGAADGRRAPRQPERLARLGELTRARRRALRARRARRCRRLGGKSRYAPPHASVMCGAAAREARLRWRAPAAQ
eukprot:scaffold92143_cov69-Phaeocystis_antarctica.AAC.5